MKKLIARYRNGDKGVAAPILVVLAAASALFTYSGASLDAETFLEKARATVFALGGASAIFLFWWYVLDIVPELRAFWQKTIALTFVLLGCSLFFWLSSAFNVAGLAGREALELHLSRYVGGLEDTLDAQFRHALIIEGVAADIRIEIARYDAAAKDEFDNGTYSGEPGPGAVFNALTRIRDRLIILLEEADTFAAEAEKQRGEAQGRLEKIRAIASSSYTLSRRMRDIAKESDLLRTGFARMDAGNLAESVSRTLDALPREVRLQANFSKNADVARRQKEALARVGEDIDHSGRVLGDFVLKQAASPAPSVKAFEKISAVRAVVLYWDNYIPFWAGGIALDIAPLAVVVFMMIGINAHSKPELVQGAIESMTGTDLLRAKMFEEVYRRASLDSESLKAINQRLLGKEDDLLGHNDQGDRT